MVSRRVPQSLVFICLLLIAVGVCPTMAETGSAAFERALSQSDFRIATTEKRIGPIRLGTPLDEVVKILGRPEKQEQDPEGGLELFYDEHAFHVGFNGGAVPRVNYIGVWDSRFFLDNGAHVGRFTSFDVARWYSNARAYTALMKVEVEFPSDNVRLAFRGAKGNYTITSVSMYPNER